MTALLVGVFHTRLSYLGRATEDNVPSQPHSYVFGSPLMAAADDQEKILVSVFILNAQERGVAGKTVSVTSQPALSLKPIQSQTDKYGQAIFEATSNRPGQFVVSASVDGQTIPQAVTLTFR